MCQSFVTLAMSVMHALRDLYSARLSWRLVQSSGASSGVSSTLAKEEFCRALTATDARTDDREHLAAEAAPRRRRGRAMG